LELNDPAVILYSDVKGTWNFEKPPQPVPETKASPDEPSSFTMGLVNIVKITGGKLLLADLLPSGSPAPAYFELRGVSTNLEQFDITTLWSKNSVPSQPTGSPLHRSASGRLTSVAYAAPAAVKSLVEAPMKAGYLRFGRYEMTNVKAYVRWLTKEFRFDDVDVEAYDGRAAGCVYFNYAGENTRYYIKAKVNNVDVARLLEAFPTARGKMTGRLDGNIKLNGETNHSPDPLAGFLGIGDLKIRDGQIPSLQLNRNLMLLGRFADLGAAAGDPSSFQSITADFIVANERLSSNKIVIVGTGVEIVATGSLTLAGQGTLDYQGVAKLSAGKNAMTNLMVNIAGSTFADGKLSVPFTLTGTMENPKFAMKPAGSRLSGLPGIPGFTPGQQRGIQGQQTLPQTPEDALKGIMGLFKKKSSGQQPRQ